MNFDSLDKISFEEKFNRSKYIHQFECDCGNMWWGTNKNKKCRKCRKNVKRLPLEEMSGIGHFFCECGRKYAGFSFGDVTSKCHACKYENYPLFILPGDKAHKDKNKKRKHHFCAVCRGSNNCPVVEEIKRQNLDYFQKY